MKNIVITIDNGRNFRYTTYVIGRILYLREMKAPHMRRRNRREDLDSCESVCIEYSIYNWVGYPVFVRNLFQRGRDGLFVVKQGED